MNLYDLLRAIGQALSAGMTWEIFAALLVTRFLQIGGRGMLTMMDMSPEEMTRSHQV